MPADELGFAHAEDLVSTLCEERLAIERARELGAPLMRGLRRPAHRPSSPRVAGAGCSNSSIRKVLDAAERVLRDAAKRGVTDAGARRRRRRAEGRAAAALVPGARARSPPCCAPPRSSRPSTAASTWEKVAPHPRLERLGGRARARARRLRHADPQGAPRRAVESTRPSRATATTFRGAAIVETLILLGLACQRALRRSDADHLDLADGRAAHPARGQQDRRGRARVRCCPPLRERLLEPPPRLPAGAAAEPAFPTRNGTRAAPRQRARAHPRPGPRARQRAARGRRARCRSRT